MCVKDPSTGKWIDCHPTGSRPSSKAARASMEKAAEATGKVREQLREAEQGGASDARIQELKDRLSRKVDKQAVTAFTYQTTDEGRAELADEVERARQRSEEFKEKALDGGPSTSTNPGFREWFDSDEHKEAMRMEEGLRAVDKVRAQQDEAVARHKEVKAGDVGEHTMSALAQAQTQQPTTQARQDYNGNWHKSTQIGVLAVDESFEVQQHYETADWHTQHKVKPGVYPVRLTYNSDGHPDMVTVQYDTTVVSDHTPALFGGAPLGGPNRSQERSGQDSTHGAQAYAFSMPGSYTPGLKAFGGSLVLHKGVVMEREMRRSSYDGRITNLTRFSFKEEPEQLEPQYNAERTRLRA